MSLSSASLSNNAANQLDNVSLQNASTSNQVSNAIQELPPENMWGALPPDLVLKIFGYLDPHSLLAASSTCRGWHNATHNPAFKEVKERSWAHYDPTKEFPAVKVINEKVWRRVFSPETLALHGLSFDDADPLDGKARTFLKGLDFTKIEGTGANTGVTILTVPKGLTFNKLIALAGSPKEGGMAAPFRYVWHRITQELGDTAVAKTYRVAISNNVLQESRGKTHQVRQQMAKDIGGQMPEFLPMVTLCSLTYMASPLTDAPIRLFSDAPWTYSGCVERIDGFFLAVGSFTRAGLSVDCYDFFFECDDVSVGFIWKF